MNLIYTYWAGPLDFILEGCTARMQAYADRIGAAYMLTDKPDPIPNEMPHKMIFNVFWDESFDDYDDIAILDADIVPRKDLIDSVFDVPGHVCKEDNWTHRKWYYKRLKTTKIKMFPKHRDGFNGGIYKFTREERQAIRPLIHDILALPSGKACDEYYMHAIANLTPVELQWMERGWNEIPQHVGDLYYPPDRDYSQDKFYHLMGKTRYFRYKVIEDLV